MQNWSPGQIDALDMAGRWLKSCQGEMARGNRLSKPIFRLFGYAGTGKTTLAKTLASGCNYVVFAAFTGKAALMMQRNGCGNASTIHSLIYAVNEDENGRISFTLDRESGAAHADLIVIDECSMVDDVIGKDLMSYGKPILVLGDPAQLPPVGGEGFFTSDLPDFLLTEIHRQADENPIIHMAIELRNQRRLQIGSYGESSVVARGTLDGEYVASADQVLVGKNTTRQQFNSRLRRIAGFQSKMPEITDRLVCLKNDKNLGIFNGGLFRMQSAIPSHYDKTHIRMSVKSDDFPNARPVVVKVRREFFEGGASDIPWQELRGTQQFDFGYALTVHKAQGSQWDHVIVYDESGISRDEWWRWLYTAVTRAADRLTLVI